jgi:TonB family protein
MSSRPVNPRRGTGPRPVPRKLKRPRGTPGSLVISTVIHCLLLLLLGWGSTQQVGKDEVKLTEISYIEERYGAEVAKKVTLVPEKLPMIKKEEPPKREGSLFAKEKPQPKIKQAPPVLAQAAMAPDLSQIPVPKPKPKDQPSPFQAPQLKSRNRTVTPPPQMAPKVEAESVVLASGLDPGPQAQRQRSETVSLNGKVLVGKKPTGNQPAFRLAADDEQSLASAGLTLVVPSGGSTQGHPELVGGSLPQGKQAYQNQLPSGNLVKGNSSQERLTSLASITVAGPGDGEGTGSLAPTSMPTPTAGKGLISRGGRDAISRGGSLRGKIKSNEKPLGDVIKKIAEPKSREQEQTPAKQTKQGGKGVSMTLSGPILGRDIISSTAPPYPLQAKQRGWQGTVSVYFTVNADGTIAKVMTEQASPYQILDQAAKDCISQWRFSALPDAAEQWGVLTIVFRLN